ncbi:hypothetical protein CBR_g47145 [Chara braunii]|uniref:DDE Tnp4 domain-containing protein n=1 Tax=Chara braunii TaxID=69332 RepID=A0A388M1R3_CHABU|nr:hypothetical protein CBR_g47145 [Chara braunii]|eukprot:GBG88445.1 hypothetical protein CBR_g47145 [Chara braunii]
MAAYGSERIYGSGVRGLLRQGRAAGVSSAAVAGVTMWGRNDPQRWMFAAAGAGHGLREEEIDVVAMAVNAVVVNTMSDMSSFSHDMLTQLLVQLCAALSSGVFPRQTPRWWIKRRTGGTWEDLRLCDDATDEYYCQKLRMSMAIFKHIIAVCAAYVEKKVMHYRMPLRVEQVIAFSLYRWASRETYESGTSALGMGRATGLQAIRDVTSALLQAYPDAIKWPVGRRRAQYLRAFSNKGFPNCFGAIDCTHIYIDKPAGARSDNYYDRKQKFSVQAQVVVDLDLRILDIHIGYPGKAGELFDAPPKNLPHGLLKRGYLLGDNGYPVACPWIVQAYRGIDRDPDEECFNKRQKVARGCVERAFGRLKCMWRLFLRTHKKNLETLPQQFVAVCTLHNILLDARIDFDENLLWEVDETGIRHRVDLGIVGNGEGGQRRSTNVDGTCCGMRFETA